MIEDLALMTQAARDAGKLAMRLRDEGLEVHRKLDGSPVTNGDLTVNAYLAQVLRPARPDYGWLSEEDPDDGSRQTCRRTFVIDPVDGTAAYARGRPYWTIVIGLIEAGRPIAGVVYAPDLDELYTGALGHAAMMNGARITASPTHALDGARAAVDKSVFDTRHWPEPWPDLVAEARSSVAYRIVSVASGAFDFTLSLTPKAEWDIAGAAIIAEVAGARITRISGASYIFNQDAPYFSDLLCATPALHPLILEKCAGIAPAQRHRT